MTLTTENKDLMFARDLAQCAFARAKTVYTADLRVAGDPALEAPRSTVLRAHFDAMIDAAAAANAAEEALVAYAKANAPPAPDAPDAATPA